ncbi:hypothetical protein FIBSPDRAFT_862180 [Athelia psychrophila]|uniref:Uncharacterized protein n=1 Tax=Athelia psychrophila TaxID=1759441 RepID=A0A166ILL0_9AGAM|nr:hypothetical protein FIBSPDRAFT_862180 [Fibularhizoctonia sp. CBS 109695]
MTTKPLSETVHSIFAPTSAPTRSPPRSTTSSPASCTSSSTIPPYRRPPPLAVPVPTRTYARATDAAAARDPLRLYVPGPAAPDRGRARGVLGAEAGVFVRVLSWNAGVLGGEEEEEGRRGW